MKKNDEIDLVRRVQRGESSAFRELVERYKRRAYAIAYDMMGTHEDAEDVSQEAFIRVYQSIKGFRGEAAFSSWFYRIVVNLCISWWRREVKYKGNLLNEEHAGLEKQNYSEDPEKALRAKEIARHVNQALQELSPKQRAVFVLRHYQGLSMKEIGEVLKCSEGTVKSQLFRAINRLQELLSFYKAELEE